VKLEDTLKELETVCEKKQIRVSYENIGGELGMGGLCKVKGEHRIIVDKRAAPGDKINVIAAALAKFPLEDVFMSDHTRGLIDRNRKPTESTP
jgi:hypothetical protein